MSENFLDEPNISPEDNAFASIEELKPLDERELLEAMSKASEISKNLHNRAEAFCSGQEKTTIDVKGYVVPWADPKEKPMPSSYSEWWGYYNKLAATELEKFKAAGQMAEYYALKNATETGLLTGNREQNWQDDWYVERRNLRDQLISEDWEELEKWRQILPAREVQLMDEKLLRQVAFLESNKAKTGAEMLTDEDFADYHDHITPERGRRIYENGLMLLKKYPEIEKL